jgi:hypothetical protein
VELIKRCYIDEKNKSTNIILILLPRTPGQCSQYSDWLWAGQLRGQNSSPSRVKNFVFSTLSRPALGSTQPPIQWVWGTLSLGVKWPGCEADHSSPTSAKVKKNVNLYIHSPIHLHGVVHRDNFIYQQHIQEKENKIRQLSGYDVLHTIKNYSLTFSFSDYLMLND